MRRTLIVLSVVTITAIGIAIGTHFSAARKAPPASVALEPVPEPSSEVASRADSIPGVRTMESLPGTPGPQASLTGAQQQHADYVLLRTRELQELAMADDTASLNTIMSELNNRDPEIRQAALDATIQFGSRDAIPKLLDAAAQTEDPKEKQAFIDAAEFLKLPSLTEVMAARSGKERVQLKIPLRQNPPPRFPTSPRLKQERPPGN